MRLDCAINQKYILCVPAHLIKASFFALYEVTCDFKARINPQSHRPCNLNRVACVGGGFKKNKVEKKAELEQAKVEAKVEPHTP